MTPASKSPIKSATKKSKFITCILPKGSASKIAVALYKKQEVTTIFTGSARGSGMSVPKGKDGVGQQIEKDLITVVVEDRDADSIFEFIYSEAKMNQPHGGFMYQGTLHGAVMMTLPELPLQD